jgi:hypothetical protein
VGFTNKPGYPSNTLPGGIERLYKRPQRLGLENIYISGNMAKIGWIGRKLKKFLLQ